MGNRKSIRLFTPFVVLDREKFIPLPLQHYLLKRLKPEDRFIGLKPEDRFIGLKPEERLKGLSLAEMEALETHIQRLKQTHF